MNLKTFYINSLRIQYQEAQLEDSIFDKCYLIENVYNDSIVAIPDGVQALYFTYAGPGSAALLSFTLE